MDLATVSISISIGTLGAVVYAIRLMYEVDKKIARLLEHQGIRP
jgi:hypothetical protein